MEKNVFDQPISHKLLTYDNIRKIATGQGDDYTTGCLLDYNYFKNYYNMTTINVSKQQGLDADPKATICFIIEEANQTVLYSSQGTILILCFALI